MGTSATKTLQQTARKYQTGRFEHLQKQNFRKKGKKNRLKTVRCRKTRAYRLTKSTPSAKCWFYRLSKPQKGKLSLSNKYGKIADNFFPCQKVNLPITVVFPHCAEILILRRLQAFAQKYYITLHRRQASTLPTKLQNKPIGMAKPVRLTLVCAKYTLAT